MNINKIKYLENAYSKSGTLFKDSCVEAYLKYCLSLPKNGIKGSYGSIFVYDSKALGEHLDNELSTGVILVDIDNISKDTADLIYNNFDKFCEYWNSLLAIQYSSSYYIKNKAGLHIFVKSACIDKYEYKKQAQICLGIFSQLVLKFLNIDLLKSSINNDPVLDFHNTNLYQRFHIFYSSFKYNEYATLFSLDDIKYEDLEKLVVKYNLQLDNEIREVIAPTLNNISIGNGKRIKIDRNVKIGNYSGNDIRFRISIIADKIFKDNAKSFCDKFFYYDKDKSIYNHYPQGNTINPLIYKWLVQNHYIIESKQNIINDWLSEYKDEIIKEIKNNKHLEIVAPTGCGKTFFVNQELAKEMNSVVIVPFNATNRLYDKLIEVNSLYIGKIPKNKPVVMIWDQAIKYWNEIRDRHLIIDEAHTLFLDRTYRDSAIKLILRLKQRPDLRHVTFISATPTNESKIFDDTKVIEFYKKRDIVSLNINKVVNIEWSQYNYIKKALDNNWYDKIVLFDDLTAKKLYEKFIIEGYGNDICYIRSDTKNSKDFIDLRENEVLRKKLTICTCVAYNGLNFKNKNEKILVVGSIKQGESVAALMIQQIGRIRLSKVYGLYFYNDNIYDKDIDNLRIRTENKIKLHIPDFLDINEKYLDDRYIEAMKEIQEYQTEFSNINKIKEQLGQSGYISGYVNDKTGDDDKKLKMTLAIKRKESDELKNDILNNEYINKEYSESYKSKWEREINRLISNEFYKGVDLDLFVRLIKVGSKNKLIESIIDNIKDIIKILTIDDNTFYKVVNDKDYYISKLDDMIDKKKFISRLKYMVNIRNNYRNKIKINDNDIYFEDVFNDIIKTEEDRMLEIINKKVNGGKKGNKKGINKKKVMITDKIKESKIDLLNKYNLRIGQVFDSYNTLSSYINKSKQTITSWAKKYWIKNIETKV